MPNVTPRWSLKAPVFNIPVANVEFSDYKPQQENFDFLANSLQQREQRQLAATKSVSDMDKALGEYREKLHQDEETLRWFDDFSTKYKNEVNNYAKYGDYGNAVNSAIRLAGEAANDPELIGRLRTSAQYKEIDDKVKSRINKDIDPEIYRWWKKTNPYKHENITVDGRIVGSNEIDINEPQPAINFADNSLAAFKLITEYKNSKSNDWSTSGNGPIYAEDMEVDTTGWSQAPTAYKLANGTILGTGQNQTGGHYSKTVQKVDYKDILARADELIAAIPGGFGRVEQSYKVYMSTLEDMENELQNMIEGSDDYNRQKQMIDERRRLISRNGSPITDYKEYYARMVTNELFAKGLAYNWETISSGSTSSSSVTPYTSSTASGRRAGSGDGSGAGGVLGEEPFEPGPNVEQKDDISSTEEILNGSVNEVMDLLGGAVDEQYTYDRNSNTWIPTTPNHNQDNKKNSSKIDYSNAWGVGMTDFFNQLDNNN